MLLADSIESISVGNRRSKYQLVDFALTRKVLSNPPAGVVYPPQPHDRFDSSRSLEYVGIPVLCELKRGRMYDIDILGLLNNPFRFTAPRTLNLSTSLKYAHRHLYAASEQLVCQAHHLFKMYGHQEEVLLVAVSGFWWSYCILRRNQSKTATAGDVAEAERYEADMVEEEDEAGMVEEDDEMAEPEPIWDAQTSRLASIFHRFEDVTQGFKAQVSTDPDFDFHLCIKQNDFELCSEWSPPLLFGTPPSNQVVYMIHHRLEMIVNESFHGSKG